MCVCVCARLRAFVCERETERERPNPRDSFMSPHTRTMHNRVLVCVCARACVGARVRARAGVRVRVRACKRACKRACACTLWVREIVRIVRASVCVRVRVCVVSE